MQKSRQKESIPDPRPDPKRFPSQTLKLAPSSTIDFDAAVRIFRAFIRDMMGSAGLNKDKLLGKPISIDDVLKAIRSFPESQLDKVTPGGITVRDLLERVSHYSRIDPVKVAVDEKLQAH